MSYDNQDAKTHVLHVFDKIGMKGAPIHGGTSMLMTWWPEFNNSNYELSLCVFRARSEGSDILEEKGIYADYIDKSKFDPRILLNLICLIKKNNIQLLHCHGYSSTNFGRVAGLICKIPVVLHEHMVDQGVPWYQKIADKFLSNAFSSGIAVSKAVNDFMCNGRSMKSNKVKVIYNGIPKSYTKEISHEEKEQVFTQHDIPTNMKLVGIVGRLNSVKGHADFLEAAKIVLEKNPKTCFLIVGEGELRQELVNKARDLQIDKYVFFLGHCDDVLKIISILDVLAVCSHSEGFPMTVLEGMVMGKAIVATSVGGIPEMLDDKKTALLVTPRAPGEASEAISKLLTDNSLAMSLGKQAYLKLNEDFLVSHTVRKIQNIYSELLR